jgi:hypothetical protein
MRAWIFIAGIIYFSLTAAAAADPTSVKVVSVESRRTENGARYTFVRAAMQGVVHRADGSSGPYKVPVWLSYAAAGAPGVLEPVHFGDGLTFLATITTAAPGTAIGAPYEQLIDGTTNLFRFGRGNYLAVMNLQDQLERLKGTTFQGIALDASYGIAGGTEDSFHIIRDASLVERVPGRYLDRELARFHKASPAGSDQVIAVGFSQSGYLLRSFHWARLNTGLAHRSEFRHGLVFDGALQDGADPGCAALDGSNIDCWGPTPRDQGKVMSMLAEQDCTQGSALLRDAAGTNPSYRTYEMAGTTHIPEYVIDTKSAGLRPLDPPDQNSADYRPFSRATLDNMRLWLAGITPPPSEYIDFANIDDPHWWNYPLVFEPRAFAPPAYDTGRRDFDYNADGGIRLPHLRTRIAGGVTIGAPLGLERGVGCLDPTPLDDPFVCEGTDGFLWLTGDFVPYADVDFGALPDPCDAYRHHGDYTRGILLAALYGVARRWILLEDLPGILQAAEERADRYPGCVPE